MKTLLATLALLTALPALAEDKKVSAGGLDFTLPSSAWTSVPTSSPMRAATLQVKAEGADKPDAVILADACVGAARRIMTELLAQRAGVPRGRG